ncbi:MAG: HD domain-containing protein [Clostridiales bacterium]|nr:HD domain-containing protein [Clostridiales bacterium]
MVEKYIAILKPKVTQMFQNESSGHDIGHLERTKNTALFLQEKEGGDRIVIGIAAFLHDIHRIMQKETGKFVSPKDSISKVRGLLCEIDITNEQKEKICHAIEYHEEYNWNNPENKLQDIETLIVQDADNLDAIGAIGIGRTFQYSGAHNVPMYVDNAPLESKEGYSEEKGDDPSTIHHFYHKLFKLGKNMNTETAKKLSDNKTQIMRKFVNDFLNEWNGTYEV